MTNKGIQQEHAEGTEMKRPVQNPVAAVCDRRKRAKFSLNSAVTDRRYNLESRFAKDTRGLKSPLTPFAPVQILKTK